VSLTPGVSRVEAIDALHAAAAAGIHAIPVPTPFAVGTMNAYLIEDIPLTLVDCGPNSALSFDTLERALGARGHRIADLGLLLITHPHMDHAGLLDVLVRRSGAEVAALEAARVFVEDFAAQTHADNAYAQRLMVRHGVPAVVSSALRGPADASAAWGCSAPLTRPLADGEAIALRDRTLRIHHRPGHSVADSVIVDETTRIAFTGDHLIANISSNPLLARPPGARLDYDGPRPRPLLDFRRSLRETRGDPVTMGLAGHGEPILDVRDLVDRRLEGYERRAEKIAEVLLTAPLQAFDIAQRVWTPETAITQTYLTLSGVLSHLDLLVERGEVAEDASGGSTLFRVIDG
jgi:glyoxylase-like metal-dependent hydrolase (beta-lactamase superfamily II)